MLTPLLETSLPQFRGRLLVVICSYRGGMGNPPPFAFSSWAPRLGPISRLLDRVSLLPLRQFIASNRDFFANIRPLDYQVGLLEDVLRLGPPAELTIRVDQALAGHTAMARVRAMGHTEIRPAAELLGPSDQTDQVLVIYPDALGLGWATLESCLPSGRAYGVNGRRRIFPLDAGARRWLRWRRLMANTRLPELLASVAIVPLAAVLAAWDALRGKS